MSQPPAAKDNARELALALAATALARALTVHLLLNVFWETATVSHLVQDIRTWREFFLEAQAGGIPYVTFTKEYPVLGGLLYWLMSPFVRADDLRQTIAVHAAFMGVADLANAWLFYRLAREIAPRRALAATLVLSLNLTALVTAAVRYESWIVTFVLLGYMAHRRRRFLLATLCWSVGCGLKWYPAFFIAAQEWRLLVVERRRWHWLGAGAVFAATTAAINLPFALTTLRETGSIHNWLAPYLFHARRPLYWDTLLGVGQIWLGQLAWERHAGLWTLALMLVAVVVRPRMGIEYKGV
ncbi:MAG TPA: glycosyltransferase family 87 protein, partial [Vicinamibacteria bacterium]|nr:glycosyltransferase family 87 protein [Vicinamibacteria bacterium]